MDEKAVIAIAVSTISLCRAMSFLLGLMGGVDNTILTCLYKPLIQKRHLLLINESQERNQKAE